MFASTKTNAIITLDAFPSPYWGLCFYQPWYDDSYYDSYYWFPSPYWGLFFYRDYTANGTHGL